MTGPDEALPLPLANGCWVMTGEGTGVRVARVKACYRVGGRTVVDLTFYANDGNRTGRESPAMGGPRHFEPACSLDGWVRIEKPSFPLSMSWITDESGRQTPGFTGVKVIPFGEFASGAPRTRRAPARPTPRKSDYDPRHEASWRRMAAQELRDLARSLPSSAAEMRDRAAKLEAEADLIMPRK